MRLVKGEKGNGDSTVVCGNFASASDGLFYARTFYELPVPGLIIQVSPESRIVDANKLAIEAVALAPGKIIGASITQLFEPVPAMQTLLEIAEPGAQNTPAATDGHPEPTKLRFVATQTNKEFGLSTVSSFEAGGEKFLILIFHTSQENRSRLVFYDALTGLPNTLAAERQLDLLCSNTSSRLKNLAIALFSLDGLRQQAATFSESFADDLITAVAERLKNWVKDGVFIARYRKDEFLLVASGRTDFREILDGVYSDLRRELVIHGLVFRFTVYGGVYLWNIWDRLSAEELLAKVRKAAQRARLESSQGYVVYRDRMELRNHSDRKVQEIIDAFRKNEFCLHFQPVVSLETGQIELAEGFLRWNHPDRGPQRPLDFLEAIESLPVYDEIGLWVLDLALLTLESWQQCHLTTRLCINLSAPQLADPVFVDRALSVIQSHSRHIVSKLRIDIVKLEDLEDALVLDGPLQRLGMQGIRFSIDDFGIGDSRLLATPLIPIDTIKIGQSYVCGIEDDLGSMFMVQGIVDFAAQYDVEVYAKGVETARQYNLLKALGCSGAQGFAIAKPLADADFVTFLQEYSSWKLPADKPIEVDEHQIGPFSFSLTEHKMLLREMLNKELRRNSRDVTNNRTADTPETLKAAILELSDMIAGVKNTSN